MTAPRLDGLDQIVAESRRRRQGLPPERDALDDIVEESRARRAQQAQQAQQATVRQAQAVRRPPVTTPMDRPVDPGTPGPVRGVGGDTFAGSGGGVEWDDGRGVLKNFGRSLYDAAIPASAEYAGSALQTFADAIPETGTAPLRSGLRFAGRALEDAGGRNRMAPARVASIADALEDPRNNLPDYIASTLGQGLGSSAGALASAVVGGLPGAAAYSYLQQVGEVGQEFDQVDPTMDRADRAQKAMLLGVPLAALDIVTEVGATRAARNALTGAGRDMLAERTAGQVARSVAGATARGALTEGATEAAQEGGSYFGTRALAGAPMDLAEGLRRMGEAGIAGALPGAFMGGGARTFEEGLGYARRQGIETGTFEPAPRQLRGETTVVPDDPDFTVDDATGPAVDVAPRKGSVPEAPATATPPVEVTPPPAPSAPPISPPVAPPAAPPVAPPAAETVPESVVEPPAPVPPPEARAEPVAPEAVTPRDLTLTFSDGTKTPARWRVADAEALQPSHNPFTFQANPQYPAGVQGRDYATDAAAQQNVQRAALELDADRLLDPTGSPEMGSPTVTPDGTVVAGNQRAMMLQRARQEAPARYAAYVDRLRQNADRYGLSETDVASVANPVLVREIDGAHPATLGRLNRLSDTSATKSKSVLDEAASRAASLRQSKTALEHFARTMGRDDSVATYLTGKDGKDFVRRLFDDGVIAPQEAARYMDVESNTLTDEGKLAVRRMLLVSAIGDAATVSRAPDAILDKLEGAVPHIIRADRSGDAEFKAGPLVQQALDVISEAREKGVKLADLIDQVDLEGNVVPEPVARMARFLTETRKKADVTEVFRQYGQFADESAARQRDGDLFGGGETGRTAAARLFGLTRESGTTAVPLAAPAGRSSPRAPVSANRPGDAAPASPAPAPALDSDGAPDAVADAGGAPGMESVLPGDGRAPGAGPRPRSDDAGAVAGGPGDANGSGRVAPAADPLVEVVSSLAETVKELRTAVEAMRTPAEAPYASPAPGSPRESAAAPDEGADAFDGPEFMEPPVPDASEPTPAPAGQLGQQIARRATDVASRADSLGTVLGGAIGAAFGGPFGAVWGAVTGYAAVRGAQTSLAKLQQVRQASAPLKALIDINRTLAASVGVPLRQGRGNLKAMRALGWYMPTTDAIRVNRFGNVRTGAHEVGHFLSNRYLNTSPQSRKAGTQVKFPKEVRAELLKAGHDLYGSRKPNGGYLEEGIAEFFRFWVTDPAKLVSQMPNARAFFDGLLVHEPTIRAALDQAQADYTRFVQAPAHAKVAAMISVNEGRWAMPSFEALWGNLKRSWLDDLHDIRDAVDALQEAKPVAASKNAYLLARLSRGAAGEAEQAIETGIRQADGTKLTQGIREALRSIPEARLNAFVEYVVAERAIEKNEQGVNTGVDMDAARAIQQQYAEDPLFKAAAEALWAHSNALIALRVEAGLLTEEQARTILSRNQKRVPFQREFKEEEQARGSFGSGKAPARNSAGIQRMVGSDRRIIDPLESILRETYDAYRQVRQHQAVKALVEHANTAPGGARFVEVLREAPKEITQMSGAQALNEVVERLTDLGILDAKATKDGIKQLTDDERGTLYAALVDFRERSQAGGRERKDLVLPLLLDGERKWVQVKDAALYEALLGMNREEQRGWVQIAAVGSKLLRAGATLTTEFIARNPGRDALSAFVRTRGGWALPFEHLARGLFHLAKKDELYETWRRAGGDNAAQLSIDRAKNQDELAALRRTLGERVLVAMTPGNWLDTLRALSAVSENATRLGEFDLVLNKERKAGAKEKDAVAAAAMAARDVTVDFAKAGTAGRAFNQIVAFFNANVQDLANMAEDLNVKRDPKRAAEVLAKAALLAVPTMALYLSQKDDDDYKEIPQDVRDRNYVYIHRAIGPDGKEDRLQSAVFTFPKSYGLAGLVSLLAERVAQYLDTQDPAALEAIQKTIVGSYVPSVAPTAALPIMEVYANRDRLRDRPIVSMGLERLMPEDQATDRTGETARILGQAVGYSPAKLEHLIVGYTAGLGRSSLEAVDWLVRGVREQAGLDPLRKVLPMEQKGAFGAPVARAFWRPLPAGNAASVTEVYEAMEEAEQAAASYARARKQGSARAEALLASRGGAVRAATSPGRGAGKAVTASIRARLDEINEERRDVMASNMEEAARRQRLRALDDERIRVARVGLSLLRQKPGARVVERPE
jgi:hypothetical protein